jgi:hypothetical protein
MGRAAPLMKKSWLQQLLQKWLTSLFATANKCVVPALFLVIVITQASDTTFEANYARRFEQNALERK